MSCGKSTLDVQDSQHKASGEVYQYIVVRFEFIKQIKQICKDLNPAIDYTSDIERKKVIAQCTIDNLSILDIGKLAEFDNIFCDNQDAYNELTPEQKANVDLICQSL